MTVIEAFIFASVKFSLIFASLFLLLVYLYIKYCHGYWKRKGVDFVEPSFPFGNIGKMFDGKTHLAEVFKDIYNMNDGPFSGFYRFHAASVMIKDPELIKKILVKDFDTFVDRGIHMDPEDPLSQHLFRLRGVKWRGLRTKLSPTFTSGKLKMMFPFVIQQGYNYQKYLKNAVEKGEHIDAKDSCIRFTLDVINSVTFGIETNTFENPNNEMRLFVQEFFDHNSSYRRGIISTLAIVMSDFMGYLGMKIFNESLTNFMFRVLKEIIDYRETNKVTRNDFLQLLIQLKNKGEVSKEDNAMDKSVYEGGKNNPQALSFEDLAAQAFVFLFAGFETSAATMANSLYELALNPDVQKQAQEEIDRVLEKHGNEWSYDAVFEMDYVGCIVSESLRKYPPLAFLSRRADSDYVIPDSNVTIEKGTNIYISLFGLHNDPKYFQEPHKYNPSRFSNENDVIPYTYMPFGEGPRHCIGMRMGKMQSRVGLAMILKDYSFSICEETPKSLSPMYGQILISPKEAIKLKVSKRT